MGHLWYNELGNTAGFKSNVGDFVDMQFGPWRVWVFPGGSV